MRKIVVSYILLMLGFYSFAQQKAQYTQYFVNQFVLNPAVAGTEDFIDAKLGVRKQWLFFPGGPFSYYLSVHTALGKHRNPYGKSKFQKSGWHGLGVYLYDDITGPTRRSGGNLAYAYNLSITRKIRVSLGAFVGFQQFRVDGDQFVLYHEQDNVLNGINQTLVPDLTLGTWVYTKDYYFGASLHQLLQNDLDFKNATANENIDPSKLNPHFFFTAGYRIPMYSWGIIPSIMVKAVHPAPVSVDISAKLSYMDGLFWTGVAYRSLDALTAIVGFTALNGRMPISYSFDLTHSELFPHQAGSHEIVIGYRLPPRPGVVCPAHFWD